MNQTIAPTYFPCSFHASKVEASTVLAAWFAVMGRGYDLRVARFIPAPWKNNAGAMVQDATTYRIQASMTQPRALGDAAPHVMTIDEQKRLASDIACFAAGFRAGQRRAKRAKQIEIPTIRG